MKRLLALFGVTLLLTSVAYAVEAVPTEVTPLAAEEAAAPAKKYFCPMDGFESDQPGKCEKCGMDLVEKPTVSEVVETAETAEAAAAGVAQQ